MKKKIITVIIILSFLTVKSQSIFNSPAILYPLEEETIIKVGEEEIAIDSILICNNNQLIIKKGKLGLIDSGGLEATLKQGDVIEVRKPLSNENDISLSIFNKISKIMNRPSSYLPGLYNEERNRLVIFPLKSKVCNTKSMKLYFSHCSISEIELKLYINDSDTLIWKYNGVLKGINFSDAPLKSNNKYMWRLYYGSNSNKGYFEILNKEYSQNLTINPLNNIIDYLSQFVLFMENGCKFDAINTLFTAIEQYPESNILKALLNKFPVQVD